MKKIPFIKGHMGGNEIVLVNRKYFSKEEELADCLSILKKPNVRGDQVGLLSNTSRGGALRAKIVDINSSNYLPMCGGLTQVLGKAHSGFDLRNFLELNISPDEGQLVLETVLGRFRIRTDSADPAGEVLSEMNPFVEDLYTRKVKKVSVSGVEGYLAGDFLVAFFSELRGVYDPLDLEPITKESREALIDFQRSVSEDYLHGEPNRDFVVLDVSSQQSDGRLLFPHNLEEGLAEASCGTGTVAAAAAALDGGLIKREGEFRLEFESGGKDDSIGGPDHTVVTGRIKDSKLVDTWLTHDNVRITASGLLYL